MLAIQPWHTRGKWPIRVQAYLRRSRLRPSPPALPVACPNGRKTWLSSLPSLSPSLMPQRIMVLTFDDVRLTAETGYRHRAETRALGSSLGLRYQTMGISDGKT